MPSFVMYCTFADGSPPAAYGVVGDEGPLRDMVLRWTQDPDRALDTYDILPVQPLEAAPAGEPQETAKAHVAKTEGKKRRARK